MFNTAICVLFLIRLAFIAKAKIHIYIRENLKIMVPVLNINM